MVASVECISANIEWHIVGRWSSFSWMTKSSHSDFRHEAEFKPWFHVKMKLF